MNKTKATHGAQWVKQTTSKLVVAQAHKRIEQRLREKDKFNAQHGRMKGGVAR